LFWLRMSGGADPNDDSSTYAGANTRADSSTHAIADPSADSSANAGADTRADSCTHAFADPSTDSSAYAGADARTIPSHVQARFHRA